jgi:hypothetical protein
MTNSTEISPAELLAALKRASGACSAALEALALDAHGEWDRAHQRVAAVEDRDACWVHAYLHRKEGDLGNAAYWYRRAEREPATASFEEEWREIAAALLAGR